MFMQSMTLEKEIENYRKERVDYFLEGLGRRLTPYSIIVLHIFPETFLDNSNNLPMFILERKRGSFSSIFQEFECNILSFPIVEGLRFRGYQVDAECRLLNNGIAEVRYYIGHKLNREDNSSGYFPWAYLWKKVEGTIRVYAQTMRELLSTNKVIAGVSIIGCKDAMTSRGNFSDEASYIDREKLFMNAMPFENIADEKALTHDINNMKLDYMLSLGISTGNELNALITELHGK